MELINGKIPKILIVDDMEINVAVLEEIVQDIGYETVSALSASDAIARFNDSNPNMVLLDIMMPEIDGYQLCELLKDNPKTRNIPVIFISALDSDEDRKRAFDIGGLDFIQKPFDYVDVETTINTHLRICSLQEQLENDNRKMNRIISEQARRFEEEQKRLLSVIARLADEDVAEKNRHQENVSYNARLLAQALSFTDKYENKISETFLDGIEIAAGIHDIGKIVIPKEIFMKPGLLTEEERAIVNSHTTRGYEILEEVYNDFENNSFIKIAAEVIRSHHENWDGSGYPDGLSREQIPLSARIISIVDNFDGLTRDHPYRSAYDRGEALRIMEKEDIHKFDPYVLEVFLKIEKQMKV